MMYPIQANIHINAVVKCARAECLNPVSNQQTAIFIVQHVMAIGYCCVECFHKAYKDTMRQQKLNDSGGDLLKVLGYEDPDGE